MDGGMTTCSGEERGGGGSGAGYGKEPEEGEVIPHRKPGGNQRTIGAPAKRAALMRVLHQLKDVDMSPQVVGAKGSAHSSGVALVLDDR